MLLREPLLHGINMEQAKQKVLNGAQWIDVRYPSEYQYDRLPGARNIPLSEIRNAFGALDMDEEYIVYCQSGRRSAAAAFLLAQRGYHVLLIEGGDRCPGREQTRRRPAGSVSFAANGRRAQSWPAIFVV